MHEPVDRGRHSITYKAPKGAEFIINTDETGLYFVFMMNGGIRPDICDRKFTNYGLAKKAVISYIKKQTQPKRPFNKAKPKVKDAKSKSE